MPLAREAAGLYNPQAMASTLYTRDILRLAAAIPHHGRLAEAQGSAERASPVCGSRIIVDVRLGADGTLSALGQEVKACALGQASSALMGAHAIGRSASELAEARDLLAAYLQGERDDPGGWPGLAAFDHARAYPARHAAILLPFDAVADAVARAGR